MEWLLQKIGSDLTEPLFAEESGSVTPDQGRLLCQEIVKLLEMTVFGALSVTKKNGKISAVLYRAFKQPGL